MLKIDQSFISGIAHSEESAAIVLTLVQLGKVLGLETVAEGIESNDQKVATSGRCQRGAGLPLRSAD